MKLTKAEAVVVGDWEADHKDFYWEQGAYEGRERGFESHVAFIKNLLATEREAGAREERETILNVCHFRCGKDAGRDLEEALTPPTK